MCVRHGANEKRCSSEECPNQAQKGGVYIRHTGAKVKRCSSDGCTNIAKQRGVCMKHGARSNDTAVKKDAQIKIRHEEYADAVIVKDASIEVAAHFHFGLSRLHSGWSPLVKMRSSLDCELK